MHISFFMHKDDVSECPTGCAAIGVRAKPFTSGYSCRPPHLRHSDAPKRGCSEIFISTHLLLFVNKYLRLLPGV